MIRWGSARRRSAIGALVVSSCAVAAPAAEPVTLRLWPDGAPDPAGFVAGPEHIVPPRGDTQMRRLGRDTIEKYVAHRVRQLVCV